MSDLKTGYTDAKGKRRLLVHIENYESNSVDRQRVVDELLRILTKTDG